VADQALHSQSGTPGALAGDITTAAPPRLVLTPARRRMIGGACVAALVLVAGERLLGPGPAALAGLVVAGTLLILWRPELAFSAMWIASKLTDELLPGARRRHVVGVALLFGVVALAAVMGRRLLRRPGWRRVRTALDRPVLIVSAYALVGIMVGLLHGNGPGEALSGSWEVLNWPLFYLIVTLTLTTPDRLGINAAFAGWYGLLSLPFQLVSIAEAVTGLSRFAGPLYALLLMPRPPLARGWLLAGLALALLDALQSSSRTTWLTLALTLAFVSVVAWRRRLTVRPFLWLVVGAGLLLLGLLAMFGPWRETTLGQGVQESVGRSAGLRWRESQAGWRVFERAPLFGHGFGYMDKTAWVAGRGAWGVGPRYHMFALTVLTAQGVIGLALALWMLSRGVVGPIPRWARRHAPRDPWAAVNLGLQGLIIGGFVGSFFAGSILGSYMWTTIPTLVLISVRWAPGFRATARPAALSSAPAGHAAFEPRSGREP
jgi:hypothetical protein